MARFDKQIKTIVMASTAILLVGLGGCSSEDLKSQSTTLDLDPKISKPEKPSAPSLKYTNFAITPEAAASPTAEQQERISKGTGLFYAKSHQEAVELLSAPDLHGFPEGQAVLGFAYLALKQPELAIESFKRSAAKGRALSIYTLGQQYSALKNHDAAVDAFIQSYHMEKPGPETVAPYLRSALGNANPGSKNPLYISVHMRENVFKNNDFDTYWKNGAISDCDLTVNLLSLERDLYAELVGAPMPSALLAQDNLLSECSAKGGPFVKDLHAELYKTLKTEKIVQYNLYDERNRASKAP